MGMWDVGPFDNDSAADWCGDLDDAEAAERPELIRDALTAAADEQGYLDSHEACAAIAAAAIVAAQHGGPAITSPYAPDFMLNGGTVQLPADVAALALRALDRVVAAESEWRALWEEADGFAAATGSLTTIREALT
ncbi:DUF4259 domain-containing protein [Streptosporangiaceae bacterium NEAU-GS5]|nr:DUF4259 domain-containing protein [Streptosporangiaceae bacterium NEAU-GS5]